MTQELETSSDVFGDLLVFPCPVSLNISWEKLHLKVKQEICDEETLAFQGSLEEKS